MAKIIQLSTHHDERGTLDVLDSALLPFPVRRFFTIHGVPVGMVRGGHGHLINRMLLVCQAGETVVSVRTKGCSERQSFTLNSATQALLLEPEDWHEMTFVQPGTVLLVLASEPYAAQDYFFEEPS